MKRTTVQLTQEQHAAVLRIARERHGGSQSAALREILTAGCALLEGGADAGAQLAGLQAAAARSAFSEARIGAARKFNDVMARALGEVGEELGR